MIRTIHMVSNHNVTHKKIFGFQDFPNSYLSIGFHLLVNSYSLDGIHDSDNS